MISFISIGEYNYLQSHNICMCVHVCVLLGEVHKISDCTGYVHIMCGSVIGGN